MLWPRLRRIRQIVQVLAFAFYVYLLFAALQRRAALPPADLFFRLDPLAALGAMLASRSWIPRLNLALITLGLTLILGRVWCGWLCPLGTLLEWVRPRSASRRAESLSHHWRIFKNWLLFIILAAAW
jgi:polyferredoxin